jgi:DNA-binding transcriptional LysR family regulator
MLNAVDLARADLNLLVLFEAVLEERHVGRAARRMHLTPSAVSHGLGRLRRLLNDPLFLRTPRGVVPTARAGELAGPIADVLARARGVIASAEPFVPATATRRFTIGAPDGVSAVLLPPLLQKLQAEAPNVDIGVCQLLPMSGAMEPGIAWSGAFAELEDRTLDVAVVPTDQVPPRFHRQHLYDEDFVVGLRAGHPQAKKLTLDRYCALQHLVVSHTADPRGFADEALAREGKERRTALTVPNFAFALLTVAGSDLACMLPRRFAQAYAAQAGVQLLEPPLKIDPFRMHAVVPEAATRDDGVSWLLSALQACVRSAKARPSQRGR